MSFIGNLKLVYNFLVGTRGWSGFRDRMLVVQKKRTKIRFFRKKITFLDIPSSYAKILVGNLFSPWEFLRSGWKVEGGERKKKKVGEYNGQLRFVRHHGWRTQKNPTKKNLPRKISDKIFVDPQFFWPNFFCWPKQISDQNFCWPQIFLTHNFLLPNIFWPQRISDQKFCWPKKFPTEFLFDPKKISTQIF